MGVSIPRCHLLRPGRAIQSIHFPLFGLLACVAIAHGTSRAAEPAAEPRATFAAESTAEPAAEPRAKDHRRLLYYVDDDGREQPVRTPDDWQRRRTDILAGMTAAMGPLPDVRRAAGLAVRLGQREVLARYDRVTLSYAAHLSDWPEDRVPAHLYLPHGMAAGERRPAVLVLHQTTAAGKRDVGPESQRANRALAHELAERGYLVLAPDYPSFGDYSYDFAADVAAGRFVSGTMKGVFNHIRAVDLLWERDDVQADRIGVIGHSLGGHNAMFLAVFDERLKVVVSSCGWTPFHDYYGGRIAGWTSDRYMPLLKTRYELAPDRVPFDFYEVVAALAPRTFFSSSPVADENFDVAGVRKAAHAAGEVYRLLEAQDRLIVRHPDCGHDFPPELRREAYEAIDRVLRAK